jgi:hypothetical protein
VTDGHAYTVGEAEALLPWLGEVLPRIRAARQVVLAGAQRIRRTAHGNGAAGKPAQAYRDARAELRRDVEAVTERGIVLRDPETGLVDFPTTREGREVFLCWRLGEDRVAFWHGPEAGFSGRRPL